MIIDKLLTSPIPAGDPASLQYSVVISSRIRLARNLKDFPFPSWAQLSQKREILSLCKDAIESVPQMKDGFFYEMENLSEIERQILVERHLISKELSEKPEGAAVAISADQSFSIMINEEDHLRLQICKPGFNFRKLWRALNLLDSALERELSYAFDEKLGYLTACPTNLGTGIRASVMMHLPALVLSGQMNGVVRGIGQLNMTVRGLYGEGSEATGSIFQISNQQTLGLSEEQIITDLTKVLHSVIAHENNARNRLVEDDVDTLCNKISRSQGLLQSSYKMTSSEALNLLSLLRLAVDLKALPALARANIDRLFIDSQPGHMQNLGKNPASPEKRDIFRAQYLKESFQKFPDLDFKKIA